MVSTFIFSSLALYILIFLRINVNGDTEEQQLYLRASSSSSYLQHSQQHQQTFYQQFYDSTTLGNRRRRLEAELLKRQSEGVSFKHSHWHSPSNGTDIYSNPVKLVKCKNQTKCIVPELQLKRKYNVYMCKWINFGIRFFYLVREGLQLHPNINLVEDIGQADLIVYLPGSSGWKKSECGKNEYFQKLVILDEGDGQELFVPEGITEQQLNQYYLVYFKRSFVRRKNGVYKGVLGYAKDPKRDVFPMTYTILEAYVNPSFPLRQVRDYDIVCTLRGGEGFDPTRLRIRQWVEEYSKARNVQKYIAGQVNSASRTEISGSYFEQMKRAKIIVTANPSGWEGDFRLMEAMASGALIFVDHMFVPRPRALKSDQHVVYFNNFNKTEFFDKLDNYRNDIKISRRVALAGYLHAMKYHRAANLIDYVFRTAHLKQEMSSSSSSKDDVSLPIYKETGYDMLQQALSLDKHKQISR